MGGQNKAFLEIGGVPVIESTIRLLKETFKEIILVTNSPRDFQAYAEDAIITEDIIKDAGPLGGIHSALSGTKKEGVFFVACDMPFLHNALIRSQLDCYNKEDCDCLVPRIGHSIEPLHAVYKKSLKGKLCNFLNCGHDRSIRSFLQTANVYYWDLEDTSFNRKIFKNLNTKEDLAEVKGTC